jgi:hypothetical protein
VIGAALLASARGTGQRRITAEIERPSSTVRRWVRSVRGSHTEWLRTQAWCGWHRSTATCSRRSSPRRLDDALAALAAAAVTVGRG